MVILFDTANRLATVTCQSLQMVYRVTPLLLAQYKLKQRAKRLIQPMFSDSAHTKCVIISNVEE